VFTDSTHYFLAVHHLSDGSKGYFAAAVSGQVPTEEMDKIYKKLDSLGLFLSSAYSVKSDCENDDYVNYVRSFKW